MYVLYMNTFGDYKIVPHGYYMDETYSNELLRSGYSPEFQGTKGACEQQYIKRKAEVIKNQIVPALSDQEVWEMFMKEYENPGYVDEEE